VSYTTIASNLFPLPDLSLQLREREREREYHSAGSTKKIHPLRSRERSSTQTFRDSASLVKLTSRLLQVSLKEIVVIIHVWSDNGIMGNAAASVCKTITSRKAVVRLLRHRREENLLSFRDRRRKFNVIRKLQTRASSPSPPLSLSLSHSLSLSSALLKIPE